MLIQYSIMNIKVKFLITKNKVEASVYSQELKHKNWNTRFKGNISSVTCGPASFNMADFVSLLALSNW